MAIRFLLVSPVFLDHFPNKHEDSIAQPGLKVKPIKSMGHYKRVFRIPNGATTPFACWISLNYSTILEIFGELGLNQIQIINSKTALRAISVQLCLIIFSFVID